MKWAASLKENVKNIYFTNLFVLSLPTYLFCFLGDVVAGSQLCFTLEPCLCFNSGSTEVDCHSPSVQDDEDTETQREGTYFKRRHIWCQWERPKRFGKSAVSVSEVHCVSAAWAAYFTWRSVKFTVWLSLAHILSSPAVESVMTFFCPAYTRSLSMLQSSIQQTSQFPRPTGGEINTGCQQAWNRP